MNRPNPGGPPPPGYHHEPYSEHMDWRVPAVNANGCRYMRPDRKACGRPAVASLFRGSKLTKTPWNYCEQHLYGGWIEDGKVMRWRVVRDSS